MRRSCLRRCTRRRKGGTSAPATVGTGRGKDAAANFPKTPTHSVEKSRSRATAHHLAPAVSFGTGHPSDVARAFGSPRVRNREVASGGEKGQPAVDKARVESLPTPEKGVLVQERSGRRAAICRLPDARAEDRFSPTPDGSGTKHLRDW